MSGCQGCKSDRLATIDIYDWNDQNGRTKAEIIDLIDRTMAKLP